MENKHIDFFVTGGPRSGTTYLYNLLSKQKGVDMSKVKETNYYLDSLSSGSVTQKIADRAAYVKQFDGHGLRGEVSPFYFFDRKGLDRLCSENPSVKVVVILRNPVYRAYSHYLMDKYKYGFKLDSFDKALRRTGGSPLIEGVENNYLDMSTYSNNLKNILEIFGSEQVVIISFEDLIADQVGECSKIMQFLGLSEPYVPSNGEKNQAESAKKWVKVFLPLLRNAFFRRFVPVKIVKALKPIIFSRSTAARLTKSEYVAAMKYFDSDINRLDALVPGIKSKWLQSEG